MKMDCTNIDAVEQLGVIFTIATIIVDSIYSIIISIIINHHNYLHTTV